MITDKGLEPEPSAAGVSWISSEGALTFSEATRILSDREALWKKIKALAPEYRTSGSYAFDSHKRIIAISISPDRTTTKTATDWLSIRSSRANIKAGVRLFITGSGSTSVTDFKAAADYWSEALGRELTLEGITSEEDLGYINEGRPIQEAIYFISPKRSEERR